MPFEWDEAKRATNRTKHGIDFADILPAFDGPMLVTIDQRYDEMRFVGIAAFGARVIVLVWTERGADVIRVISVRKANAKERKAYQAYEAEQAQIEPPPAAENGE